MLQQIQTLINHDAFGVAIFLGLVGIALYLNAPREYQTASGLAVLTVAAAPAFLVAAAVLTSPLILMPVLFLLGIWCHRRCR